MTAPDTLGYEPEPTDVAAEIEGVLGDITDPEERYHRATAAQVHHEAVSAALADERAWVCAAWWDGGNGLPFAKIGELIGASRSRAQQLVERGRALPATIAQDSVMAITAVIEHRTRDLQVLIRLSDAAGLDATRAGSDAADQPGQANPRTQTLIDALAAIPEVSDVFTLNADSPAPKINIAVCWTPGSDPTSVSKQAWTVVQQTLPGVTLKRAFWER